MLILKSKQIPLSKEGVSEVKKELLEVHEQELVRFLLEWYNDSDEMLVRTSGTTGAPKEMIIAKKHFVESAKRSLDFLNLKRGETALLSLSTDYIAGKLMVIRAIVGGLNLCVRKPASNPLLNLDEDLDFAAFVPMQIARIVDSPEGWEKFKKIRTVIIGGAVLERKLEKRLRVLGQYIYHTYGMTETLTHVAMRKIAPFYEDCYHAMRGVSFSIDKRGCLQLRLPYLYDKTLETNDLVELVDAQTFKYVGRYDNVINSGGIKLSPELIESKLSPMIEEPFYVSAEKDEVLGEKLVLFVERDQVLPALSERLKLLLEKYECPKHIYYEKSFQRNSSGKIIRKKNY